MTTREASARWRACLGSGVRSTVRCDTPPPSTSICLRCTPGTCTRRGWLNDAHPPLSTVLVNVVTAYRGSSLPLYCYVVGPCSTSCPSTRPGVSWLTSCAIHPVKRAVIALKASFHCRPARFILCMCVISRSLTKAPLVCLRHVPHALQGQHLVRG